MTSATDDNDDGEGERAGKKSKVSPTKAATTSSPYLVNGHMKRKTVGRKNVEIIEVEDEDDVPSSNAVKIPAAPSIVQSAFTTSTSFVPAPTSQAPASMSAAPVPPPALPPNSTVAVSPAAPAAAARPPSFPPAAFKTTSAPKEPSKLRFSYTEPSDTGLTQTGSLKSALTVGDETAGKETETVKELPVSTVLGDPKTKSLSVPLFSLPTYVFTARPSSSPVVGYEKEKELATRMSDSALPVFDFSGAAAVKSKGKGKENQAALPAAPAVTGFNYAAAGMKPPSAKDDEWICQSCMLPNKDPKSRKCGVCEADRE